MVAELLLVKVRVVGKALMEAWHVPWKRRFYGGFLAMVGLLVFVFLYRPYYFESGFGVSLFVCPFRNLTGLPCPGCGMTRAVYHIARGEVGCALSLHVFSPLFYVGVFAELVNCTVAIVRRGKPLFSWTKLFNKPVIKCSAVVLVITVLGYNLYRIFALVRSSSGLSDLVHDSVIYRLMVFASSFFAS